MCLRCATGATVWTSAIFFSSLLLLCGLSCPSISILTIVLITLIRFLSSLLWSCWNGARATQCNVHERRESGTRRNGQTLFPWHQRAQCTHRTTPHRTTQNLELDIYWLLYFRFSTSPATIISHRTRRAIHLFFSLSHLALSVTTSNRLLLPCLIVVDHRKFCAPRANYSARRIFQSWTESVVRRHPATIAPTTTCIMFVCVFVHFSFLFWLLALYVFCFFFLVYFDPTTPPRHFVVPLLLLSMEMMCKWTHAMHTNYNFVLCLNAMCWTGWGLQTQTSLVACNAMCNFAFSTCAHHTNSVTLVTLVTVNNKLACILICGRVAESFYKLFVPSIDCMICCYVVDAVIKLVQFAPHPHPKVSTISMVRRMNWARSDINWMRAWFPWCGQSCFGSVRLPNLCFVLCVSFCSRFQLNSNTILTETQQHRWPYSVLFLAETNKKRRKSFRIAHR